MMTGDTGYVTPTNKIICFGKPPFQFDRRVETATNMYPGRLVKVGTTANDVVVNDGLSNPVGWISYEGMNAFQKKDSYATILAQYDTAKIVRGGGFSIYATMGIGFTAKAGDLAINWINGTVAPAKILPSGQLGCRVPFVFNVGGTVTDTGIDVPAGMVVGLPQIYVTTIDATETIDIGFINAVEGGDEDGLIKLASIGTAGWVQLDVANTTTVTDNIGAYIAENELKDATADTPYYFDAIKSPGIIADGTIKSLTYTPSSSDTGAGYFFVPFCSVGTRVVGVFAEDVTGSTSATAAARIESIL